MSDAPLDALFSAARWDELRSLLVELTDASFDKRHARLLEIAAEDATLASSLRDLLADLPDTGTQTPERVIRRIVPESVDEMPLRVGPFRLLQRIGAGGMGVIYLAEREQVDFVQQVALKLLDGGSTSLARLAARERRILAALTHPNITAFVDAGSFAGRAWMAMEYVEGEPLLDYCRRNELTARERVALFDQVCSAVVHAHAQLVVHRDLKPSNILVNQAGNAKLLDFGIALILDSGEESEPATRVFTPEYAAPEQLRGERASTATDIHALGLVLFELIAGQRLPTRGHDTGDREWRPTELARFATAAVEKSSQPDSRRSDPNAVRKLLRGDLGRVIAHAINPRPQDRYASVASLREDLERWLHFRPLGLGRPRMNYIVGRFVRRHPLGTALAILGAISIITLGCLAVWQAHAKSAEAERAKIAFRQSEATRDFMSSIFLSADPIMGRSALVTVDELLETARERIGTRLANQPDIAADLLFQIGNVYVSKGNNAAVRETLGKAIAVNRRRAQPSATIEGSSTARLAYLDFLDSRSAGDLQRIASAIAGLRSAAPSGRDGLADALGMYGNALYNSGHVDEAVLAEVESVGIFESLGDESAPDYLEALLGLSDMYASLERFPETLSTAEKALAHPFVNSEDGRSLRNELLGERARGLMGVHRYREAEAEMADVIKTGSATSGFEKSTVRYWRYRRVQVLDMLGRLEEARLEIDKLLDVPASNDEQPIAQIAHLVMRLAIDVERRSADASVEVGPTRDAACGAAGNPVFCARTRLFAAELAIRERHSDLASAALEACRSDEAIKKDPVLQRRLLLLMARQSRVGGKLGAARSQLEALQSQAGIANEESAQFNLERGYLALASHENREAIEAMESARKVISGPLVERTPIVDEIDDAIASARRNPD